MVHQWRGRCSDGQTAIHKAHRNPELHQFPVVGQLAELPAENLGRDVVVAFPLVDDNAIVKVAPVVYHALQPSDDRVGPVRRGNATAGLAVDAVFVVVPSVVRFGQQDEKVLQNKGEKQRAVYLALLAVGVLLGEFPVFEMLFVPAIGYRCHDGLGIGFRVGHHALHLPFVGVALCRIGHRGKHYVLRHSHGSIQV